MDCQLACVVLLPTVPPLFICIQIYNARVDKLSSEHLRQVMTEFEVANAGACARDLQMGSRAWMQRVKEGEETKQKSYQAVCWLSRSVTAGDIDYLNSVRNLVVKQDTPVRVLHRRAAKIRDKMLCSIRCAAVANQPHYIVLEITTQAGTYIKEFVHGDFGRSNPSVGDMLGCHAEILQLDVTNVHMDWT